MGAGEEEELVGGGDAEIDHKEGEKKDNNQDEPSEEGEFVVEPIEESSKSIVYKPVLERYYTAKYCLDVVNGRDDYCILIHTNRVCMVTLAPSHYIFDKKVVSVDFKIKEGLDRSSNSVSGKWKHGAQKLLPSSPILVAVTDKGERHPLLAAITGKLLEVNLALLEEPKLMFEQPQGRGYLALVLPEIPVSDRYRKFLTNEQEYKEKMEVRQGKKEPAPTKEPTTGMDAA